MGELQGERRKDEDNQQLQEPFDSKGEEFLYVKKLVEKLGTSDIYDSTGVFDQRLNQMYQTGRLQRQQDTILIKS